MAIIGIRNAIEGFERRQPVAYTAIRSIVSALAAIAAAAAVGVGLYFASLPMGAAVLGGFVTFVLVAHIFLRGAILEPALPPLPPPQPEPATPRDLEEVESVSDSSEFQSMEEP